MEHLRKVGNGSIDTHISIEEASRKMRANFEAMEPECRAYIIAHFVDHCRDIGMTLSPEFTIAFDIACNPWRAE